MYLWGPSEVTLAFAALGLRGLDLETPLKQAVWLSGWGPPF